MPDRPYRVGVWAAVSSRPQAAEDKSSLADQRAAGEQFAAAVGGDVVARYTVPGHSRDYVLWQDAEAEMPAYRQLREDCERQALDVLYAIDADRLGRTAALVHQVIGVVEASGAEVYLASSPHQLGQRSVAHNYLTAIQAVRAQEEQAIRVGRQNRGIRNRVRRGLPPGRWPYGYRAIRDTLGRVTGGELVPEEAEGLRLMTRLYLEGVALVDIAAALDRAGFAAPASARWARSSVHRTMRRDIYGGYPEWGDVRPDAPSSRYPALWDEATFAAVRAERARRRPGNTRGTSTSPLLGVAICARCGGRMTRHILKGRYYLRCSRHARWGVCHANNAAEDALLSAVIEALCAVLETPEAIAAIAAREAQPRDDLERRAARIDARADDVAQRRQRIALALAAGQLDPQMYRTTDDALLDELAQVNAARVSLEEEIAATPTAAERAASLERLQGAMRRLDELPPRQVQRLLQRARVRVLVEDKDIVRIEVG